MNVLVTGAAGFIGTNLCSVLRAAGHTVQGFDVASDAAQELLSGFGPQHLEGIGAVVHLAALPGIPQSVKDPGRSWLVNAEGTLTVLESCRHAGVTRVLVASSAAAAQPATPYAAAKRAAEDLCRAYAACYGLGTLACRFTNVYGPHSAHKNSVVALFCRRILAGQPLPLHDHGLALRDFVFVGDVCCGLVRALEGPQDRLEGQTITFGSGKLHSVVDVALELEKLAQRSVRTETTARRAGEPACVAPADLRPAAALCGYQAWMPLRAGLQITWDWFAAREGTPTA